MIVAVVAIHYTLYTSEILFRLYEREIPAVRCGEGLIGIAWYFYCTFHHEINTSAISLAIKLSPL